MNGWRDVEDFKSWEEKQVRLDAQQIRLQMQRQKSPPMDFLKPLRWLRDRWQWLKWFSWQ